MAHMESLWPRLAELPLVVESCEYDRLLRGSPDSCPGFPPAEGLRTTGEHTFAVDKTEKSELAVRGCSLPPDEAVAPSRVRDEWSSSNAAATPATRAGLTRQAG